MQRINTDSAAHDLHGDGKAGFSDAIPTRLSASWFNGVQEEIAGFIESQNIALDAADKTQLAQAIAAYVGDAQASFKSELLGTASSAFDTLGELQAAVEAGDAAAVALVDLVGTHTTQLATLALGSKTVTAVNNQTGAAYTLAISDAGGYVRMNNAAANTVTVPPNSSVAFPVNSVVTIRQVGAGKTTIVAGSGVTVTSPATLGLRAQHSTVQLVKVGADAWDLIGDLAT